MICDRRQLQRDHRPPLTVQEAAAAILEARNRHIPGLILAELREVRHLLERAQTRRRAG